MKRFKKIGSKLAASLLAVLVMFSFNLIPTYAAGAKRTTTLNLTNESWKNGCTNTSGSLWTNAAEKWSYDTGSNTLTLSGVDFEVTDTFGIAVNKNLNIVLTEGTSNSIVTTSSPTGMAIYFMSDVGSPINCSITGTGELTLGCPSTQGSAFYQDKGTLSLSFGEGTTVVASGGYSAFFIGSTPTVDSGSAIKGSTSLDGSNSTKITIGEAISKGKYKYVKIGESYSGVQAGAPSATPTSKTTTSITLDPITITGETVEYACNATNVAPKNGWQDSTSFMGLSANTTYYFFARIKANDSHWAGTASTGTAITTTKSDTVNKDTESPKTGDTSNTMLYFSLVILSGCAVAFILRRIKALTK